MINVKLLLHEMLDQQASDIHLKVGSPPFWRINGQLVNFGDDRLTHDQMEELAASIMDEDQQDKFAKKGELDFARDYEGWRLRVNLARERGHASIVMRIITKNIYRIEDLFLPPVLKEIALEPRGLILVTGTAGSGKSTTIASMINLINEQAAWTVVTIEDPIEYTHADNKSCIIQREVGVDTETFATAVRAALRQDPDLIMVGEMRDPETILAAINAAETGHLVMSTLHTIDASQTVDRIVDSFPGDQHAQVRGMLATSLTAIISLRLLRRADGQGRVPAVEVLVATPTIRSLIREQKTKELHQAIKTGAQYGMQTFDQSLLELLGKKLITPDVALAEATSPSDLKLAMEGITAGAGKK